MSCPTQNEHHEMAQKAVDNASEPIDLLTRDTRNMLSVRMFDQR